LSKKARNDSAGDVPHRLFVIAVTIAYNLHDVNGKGLFAPGEASQGDKKKYRSQKYLL
jgi:hypothetical protein